MYYIGNGYYNDEYVEQHVVSKDNKINFNI